ncbi:hypothetical protein Hte_011233 [Hypoxylon texense]
MRLVRGVFAEKDCKFVIQQVLNAIRYLHEGGIAHRDLKPENILFAAGPYVMSRVILSDLGSAKSTASGRMASQVGTIQYMAPEVEYGRTHDLAVDIWSLGMIVMFLLAPDHLVAPSGFMEWSQVVINQWLDSAFEDPSHQEISQHCQRFIRSCLMFEPSHRIKASEARDHPWFQQPPDKSRFKFQMQEYTKTWKPTHLIAPPVQELPDILSARQAGREDAAQESAATTNLGKRKFFEAGPGADCSKVSPYFAEPKPPASKRLKSNGSEKGNPRINRKTKQSANKLE